MAWTTQKGGKPGTEPGIELVEQLLQGTHSWEAAAFIHKQQATKPFQHSIRDSHLQCSYSECAAMLQCLVKVSKPSS